VLEYLSDWSADGEYLTVGRRAPLCPVTLKTMEAESGEEHEVMENALGGSFSPDGTQLALAYAVDDNWEIGLVDIATGEIVRRLTHNDAADWGPDWGPEVVPLAPSSLRSVSVSSDEVRLGWRNNSDNETGFIVQRRAEGAGWVQIASVSAGTTSYTDSQVSSQTRYSYRVSAFNGAGGSGYSNALDVTTPLPPVAEEADSAIEAARYAILQEEAKGFDISAASQLLAKAEAAATDGSYNSALAWASEAKRLALDIDLDSVRNEEDFLPSVKNGFVYTAITSLSLIMLVIAVVVYRAGRRRRAAYKKASERAKAELIGMIDEALRDRE